MAYYKNRVTSSVFTIDERYDSELLLLECPANVVLWVFVTTVFITKTVIVLGSIPSIADKPSNTKIVNSFM